MRILNSANCRWNASDVVFFYLLLCKYLLSFRVLEKFIVLIHFNLQEFPHGSLRISIATLYITVMHSSNVTKQTDLSVLRQFGVGVFTEVHVLQTVVT